MRLVKGLRERQNIRRPAESVGWQAGVQLPHLRAIPRFDHQFDVRRRPLRAMQPPTELGQLLLDRVQRAIDAGEVEAGGVGEAAARRFEDDGAVLHSAGRERGGQAWQHHRGAAQLAGDGHDVEARGPAAGHHHALARVQPFIDRDLADGLDHELIGDGHDGGRRLVRRAADLVGQPGDDAGRGWGIQLQPAAVEIIRVDVAQMQSSVRHCRLVAAAPVAGRPRGRACRLRSHPQQPAGIEPGDGAATSADGAYIHGRGADEASHALAVTHRTYVMENGRVLLEGPSAELANDDRVLDAYLGRRTNA